MPLIILAEDQETTRRMATDLLLRVENPDVNWQRRSRWMLDACAFTVGMDEPTKWSKDGSQHTRSEGIGSALTFHKCGDFITVWKNAGAFHKPRTGEH
jgi:hypothetical protein